MRYSKVASVSRLLVDTAPHVLNALMVAVLSRPQVSATGVYLVEVGVAIEGAFHFAVFALVAKQWAVIYHSVFATGAWRVVYSLPFLPSTGHLLGCFVKEFAITTGRESPSPVPALSIRLAATMPHEKRAVFLCSLEL